MLVSSTSQHQHSQCPGSASWSHKVAGPVLREENTELVLATVEKGLHPGGLARAGLLSLGALQEVPAQAPGTHCAQSSSRSPPWRTLQRQAQAVPGRPTHSTPGPWVCLRITASGRGTSPRSSCQRQLGSASSSIQW
jgi:hypothetical protein